MHPFAPVAQLDRVPDYESGGRTFESYRARHIQKEPHPTDGAFFVSGGSSRGDVPVRSAALGKIQLNAQANWVVKKLRHIEPGYQLFLVNLTKLNEPRLTAVRSAAVKAM